MRRELSGFIFWVCLFVSSSFFLGQMNNGPTRETEHDSQLNFFFFPLHDPGLNEGLCKLHSPLSRYLSTAINWRTPRLWGYESIEMHPEMIPAAHLLFLMSAPNGLWLLGIS